MVEESWNLYTSKEMKEYRNSNRLFHKYIYDIANNPHLSRLISEMWDLSKRYTNYTDKNIIKISIEEHSQIVEVLKQRNSDLAENIIQEHNNKVK